MHVLKNLKRFLSVKKYEITTADGYNESTTGADASVEMPKLHNIKLLIAFVHDKQFNFAACKNSESG